LWEGDVSEKKAVQHEKGASVKGLQYAAVGLILGAGVGFALGGPVTAANGAGIGLVLGAGIDAALRRKKHPDLVS
jgi:outer membrane lipoprotein SlyB